jgi:hypothetical protein
MEKGLNSSYLWESVGIIHSAIRLCVGLKTEYFRYKKQKKNEEQQPSLSTNLWCDSGIVFYKPVGLYSITAVEFETDASATAAPPPNWEA